MGFLRLFEANSHLKEKKDERGDQRGLSNVLTKYLYFRLLRKELKMVNPIPNQYEVGTFHLLRDRLNLNC